MQVKSTVKMDFGKIEKLTKAAVTALKNTAEEVRTDVTQAQVVPFQSGNLQNESTFVDDSLADSGIVSIVSSTPYARRLYFHPEYNFSKEENPNARGNWYEPWIDGSKKNFAKDAFKRFYREESGL